MSTVLSPEETAKLTDLPIEDLESWLEGEIEKPCEMLRVFLIACLNPSFWLLYYKRICNCDATNRPIFICDPCKEELEMSMVHLPAQGAEAE